MRLNQVTVTVRNIDESVAFYAKVLGAGSPSLSIKHHPVRDLSARRRHVSIHIAEPSQNLASSTTVYFESDRLDDWCAELATKGITFESPPETSVESCSRKRTHSGNAI